MKTSKLCVTKFDLSTKNWFTQFSILLTFDYVGIKIVNPQKIEFTQKTHFPTILEDKCNLEATANIFSVLSKARKFTELKISMIINVDKKFLYNNTKYKSIENQK